MVTDDRSACFRIDLDHPYIQRKRRADLLEPRWRHRRDDRRGANDDHADRTGSFEGVMALRTKGASASGVKTLCICRATE